MSTEITPAMRRSVLIATLRDKSLWPEGFRWDFTDCHTCAVGLLMRTMNMNRPDGLETDNFMAQSLGLCVRDAHETFVSPWNCYRRPAKQVTPEMVADRLEAIHERLR